MSVFDVVFAVKDALTVGRLNNPQSKKAGEATSQRIAFGGVLFAANGSLGNNGAGETPIYSRTLAADALPVNGDRLEVDLSGDFAANANAGKKIRLKLGSHGTYFEYDGATVNGGYWDINAIVTRLSNTTARARIRYVANSTSGYVSQVTIASLTGLDFSTSQTLSQSLLSSVATSDVVARDYLVRLWPGTAEVT